MQTNDNVYLRSGAMNVSADTSLTVHHVEVQPYPNEIAWLDLLEASINLNGASLSLTNIDILSTNPERESAESVSDPTDIPTPLVGTFGTSLTLAGASVHDVGQFALWTAAQGAHLLDCHFYNIGWDAPDRGHGHCLYGQGTGTERVIENCIYGQTFAYGLHLYGQGSSSFDHWTFRNCIFFCNPNIIGGTPGVDLVDNITFEGCIFFDASIDYGYQSVALGTLTLTSNAYLDTTKVVSVAWDTVNASGETTDAGLPLTMWVFPCVTAPKVAHLAVWNPAELATVDVDVTALSLVNGATYRLRNAYDPFDDTDTFVYDNSGEITVTFTGRTVALPTGYGSALATIDARFGCWILEAA